MASNSLQILHFPCPRNASRTHTKPHFFKIDSSATTLTSTVGDLNRWRKKKNGLYFPFCASSEGAEKVQVEENNPEEIISGEWPENFSLLNYDDLRAYLEPEIFKDKMEPSALLAEVMSTLIRTATSDQTVEEIDHHFEFVSGLPVIDGDFKCIGVISKRDKQRAPNGLKSKVGEIMSSPAVTLSPDKTVLEAAVLMLKEKFHRIPIVNEGGQVVGMVTRTDIFKALEGLPS